MGTSRLGPVAIGIVIALLAGIAAVGLVVEPALTTHQIRQYQLARCAAGAATGTINRETSALHRMGTLAVHWGWLDTVPGFPDRLRENPPRQGFLRAPRIPCRPRPPACPVAGHPRPRVKGGAKLDHRGGGKLDHPAVEWRG